jgi:hypothetical protein
VRTAGTAQLRFRFEARQHSGVEYHIMASLKRKTAQEPRRAPPFKPPRRMDPRPSDANIDLSEESLPAASVHRSRSNATTSGRRRSSSSPVSSGVDDTRDSAESVDESAQLDSTTTSRRRRSTASRLAPSTPRRQSTNLGQSAVQDAAALLQDDPNEHSISRALITRILVSGFQDKNTKIGKEALGIVEMYMRLFIKESIARTRQEAKNKDGVSLVDISDDWLQVDDLEKIAPQLILDF